MRPGAEGRDATPFRLLTGLFLRRFVENDLVSIHVDRHESLAVILAFVVSLSLFVTFLLSDTYLATFILLPGPAALSALGDRFLFIAASMVIGALGALAVWDALALEPRDASILGPLPVRVRTMTWAKLTAAVVFGGALAIALNAVPAVLYPLFFTSNIRGVRLPTVGQLVSAHGVTVTMAGLLGFFSVIAVRSVLRLLTGDRSFRRASSIAQSALVVFTVTALLLAARVRAPDVRGWLLDPGPPWPVRPVLWYLSLNEAVAGHKVAEAPLVLPARLRSIPLRPRQQDQAAREVYRAMARAFPSLARRAWLSWLAVTGLALMAFLWTNRHLPDRSAYVPKVSRARSTMRRVVERFTQSNAEAQAGFFFALQTIARSAPHRTILAIAVALGVTHAFVVLSHPARLGVLAISTLLVLSLAGGLRYAVTVPAELRGNWAIRMAWLGDERGYLLGTKRAGLLLVSVVLLLLLPLHVALVGWPTAIAHSVFGLATAIVAIDAFFLRYRKLPFACGYVPPENPKLAWPAGFVGLILSTYGLALVERWALEAGAHEVAFASVLAVAVVLIKAIDSRRRRERDPVDFDGWSAPVTQRLGLANYADGE